MPELAGTGALPAGARGTAGNPVVSRTAGASQSPRPQPTRRDLTGPRRAGPLRGGVDGGARAAQAGHEVVARAGHALPRAYPVRRPGCDVGQRGAGPQRLTDAVHNLEAAGAYLRAVPILALRKAKKSLTCSLRFFMTWST
jgi:hypothetical protein